MFESMTYKNIASYQIKTKMFETLVSSNGFRQKNYSVTYIFKQQETIKIVDF